MANWKLTAEDRFEIEDLYARYAWGIDLADEDLVCSVFAQDGWFDHLWQGRVQGHDAILENFRSLWTDRQSWWYGRQHIQNTKLFTEREEEGEVDVKLFFQILQYNVDYNNNFVFGIGTRQDHLTKKEGRWLFQSLHVNAWNSFDQVPWKGPLVIKGRPKYQMAPVPEHADRA
ncbi:nuclear transport factor 2 family protein [Microbacterium terregens]|uniref:Nuclear transport factor 2 family protein n=1 Tax=Microbacterium terregens TaxID=69363 RepID=A0ABV5T268_9MICO